MLDKIKHRTVLIHILREMYDHASLAPLLGFKGGTAAFLFYQLPRMSVDLDFDLLDSEKQEIVFEALTKIFQKFGRVEEAEEKKYTLFWLISYEKGQHHAKIEISKRPMKAQYEIKNLLGTNVLVIKQEDMFANKLAAVLGRKKPVNRDLYDIWYFLDQHWDLNTKLVEAQAGMTFSRYLQKCIHHIEKIDSRYLLAGLGELVDNKTKYLVKEKLKDELLFLLRLKLSEL